ncbi:hypothetical protein BDW66DRAFT_144035, partial [Aspergillus desertorum]
AAIRGEQIPRQLKGRNHLLCLLRGIRHNPGFAMELRGKYRNIKCIDRVLNARSIMSNVIPDMAGHYEMPYCIWYPDVASEETYRQLAARYPEMRYQVGRACAVANYVSLYKELDLLPDVHIAEEARDNNAMEIYDLIMASEVKYDVMDDYTRTVNLESPRAGVHLNGDTAVRSLLKIKQEHSRPFFKTPYFDITEDMNIDSYTTPLIEKAMDDVSPLLYSPLPVDLPTVNKDPLILMAAYYGDIDRYVRLQRPVLIPREADCVIRGIFHNTLFAKWWSLQDLRISRYDSPVRYSIERAITARFIMNNDLSRILKRPDTEPDCIWYPAHARPETYRELARRVPSMTATVAHACIVAGYWRILQVLPEFNINRVLLREAELSANPLIVEEIKRRIAVQGIDIEKTYSSPWEAQNLQNTLYEESTTILPPTLSAGWMSTDGDGIYNGIRCNASYVELFVCAPKEWRLKDDQRYLEDLYQEGNSII